MEEDRETRQIVRVYSFNAEDRLPSGNDAHVLARVLSENETSLEEITEPWRKFFEPWESTVDGGDPVTTKLSVEAAKLHEQWQKFQQFIPQDERIDLSTEPSGHGIISMVKKASESWQDSRGKGKTGKAVSYFHRFCGTLDSHSNMMKVIPNGNQYVSLFTGTATTIIKASVKHEKIVEDLARALCVISEHIKDCETELRLFRTETMMESIVELYAHIFLFLNDTMDWYLKKRRKRLVDSFNEKFYEHFQEEIENINRMSHNIKRRADQNAAAEQRATRLTLERTDKDLRLGLEGVLRQQAELIYGQERINSQMERDRAELREEKNRFASLHAYLQSFLTDEAQLFSRQSPPRLLPYASDPTIRGFVEPYRETMKRDDVLLNSAGLEDFFHRDRIRLERLRSPSNMIDPQALSRLVEWTASPEAQFLNIEGAVFEGDESENPIVALSTKFIDFAAQSKVPMVSYFCELRRRQKIRTGNTREFQGLLELLYALIRQTAELIPRIFDSDKEFTVGRFQKLDGSPASFESALELFRDLQILLPGRILCVISGFEWVDDRSTANYVIQIVEALREEKLKVLFTTSGHSRSLLSRLSKEEIFVSDSAPYRATGELWKLEGKMIL